MVQIIICIKAFKFNLWHSINPFSDWRLSQFNVISASSMNSTIPEKEPRGSNSSKPSNSLFSEAGAGAGAGGGATEVLEVVLSWWLVVTGGEEDLGTDVAEVSPSLETTANWNQFNTVHSRSWVKENSKYYYLSLWIGLRASTTASS